MTVLQPPELQNSQGKETAVLFEKPDVIQFQGIFEQEFKAKETFQQAAPKIGVNRRDSRNPGETKRHRKGKGSAQRHAVHGEHAEHGFVGGNRPLKQVATLARSPKWMAEARVKLKARLFSATTLASKDSKR